jgi:hypothetical protein
MLAFTSAKELREAVSEARSIAKVEAERSCGRGFLSSRGAWFIATRDNGAESNATDGTIEFKGTQKQLDDEIARLRLDCPDINDIYIEGGFNFAETMADLRDHVYEPWVSEWSVLAWSRDRDAS